MDYFLFNFSGVQFHYTMSLYKTDADLAFKNKFMQNEEFRSLKAIRKGRVYMIPISYIYNSGLRLSDTIHLIAAGLYN